MAYKHLTTIYFLFRLPNQLWVMMSYEAKFDNTAGYGPKMRYDVLRENPFNLTMSYRLDSDIVVRHGRTV